ncbi:MAG: hypothetical protein F6K09_25995 [Merismopedia sp. SIO2A8]|nr:hypothetical protein [Symploca sp. SIO2B6]NET52022.1 hypothetical protein [Merismopedia sp. SIO2A8]
MLPITSLTAAIAVALSQPSIANPISQLHQVKQHPSQPLLTKQQPVETKTPRFIADAWVPVARVNPGQPATIVLVNDTTVPVEYSFSNTITAPEEIAPQEEIVLSNVPIPATLLINALNSAAVLDFAFSPAPTTNAPNNTVTVTISLVNQQYDAIGFTAIDVDTTGALYRY